MQLIVYNGSIARSLSCTLSLGKAECQAQFENRMKSSRISLRCVWQSGQWGAPVYAGRTHLTKKRQWCSEQEYLIQNAGSRTIAATDSIKAKTYSYTIMSVTNPIVNL